MPPSIKKSWRLIVDEKFLLVSYYENKIFNELWTDDNMIIHDITKRDLFEPISIVFGVKTIKNDTKII